MTKNQLFYGDETPIIKNKNTIYKKKSILDQFYTQPETAQWCYNTVMEICKEHFDIFLEPSAGTGSFFFLFPEERRIGLDTDPQNEHIQNQDFFDYYPLQKKIITIGNPPFGKNASLAIKFFNHAAKFSNTIAFILPRTFQKESIHKKLNPFFQIVLNHNLPKNSFLLNNKVYDVPCCFQIWKKTDRKRIDNEVKMQNKYFSFVKKHEANIAVRRVGGRAGKATKNLTECADTTHYFLKTNFSPDTIIEKINAIDFTNIVTATAGVRSLSKPEFIREFYKVIL